MRDNVPMAEAVPAEQAARRFAEIIESVSKRRERVTITTPDGGKVVLMNAADLEGLEETLEILSDPEEVTSIREGIAEAAAGNTIPLEEAFPREKPLSELPRRPDARRGKTASADT